MHGFANPARFLRLARRATPWCLGLGVVIAALALGWGVLFGPADRLQGDTVRIVYLHVPTAWLGMMGWGAIATASFAEIVWRHPLATIAARAVAVPGAVFTAVCLATGSLWGRPAWGAWWVWDGRLTSMLVPGWGGEHSRHPLFGDLVEQPASTAQHHDGQQCHGAGISGAAAGRDVRVYVDLYRRGVDADARHSGQCAGRSPIAPQGGKDRLMAETFAQWPYVIAAYALGTGATFAMVAVSWQAMRRAEKRRDEARKL